MASPYYHYGNYVNTRWLQRPYLALPGDTDPAVGVVADDVPSARRAILHSGVEGGVEPESTRPAVEGALLWSWNNDNSSFRVERRRESNFKRVWDNV